jgi:hypothetical protein
MSLALRRSGGFYFDLGCSQLIVDGQNAAANRHGTLSRTRKVVGRCFARHRAVHEFRAFLNAIEVRNGRAERQPSPPTRLGVRRRPARLGDRIQPARINGDSVKPRPFER